jgi:two-component system, NtrC family, nitrogen regulation sensor histidine kinase NtrY
MASNPPHTGGPTPLEKPPNFRRIPLQARSRRVSYERRVKLWLFCLAAAALLPATALIYLLDNSLSLALGCLFLLAAIWAIGAAYLFEQLTRPLQTLSNVVSALREDDFSFRTRGARRGDSLGDLALEINALADTLQRQRLAARDALTLVETVMTSMQAPVFAFDPAGHLRLLNAAAETSFRLERRASIGHSAAQLNLAALLGTEDQGLYSTAHSAGSPDSRRWSVRRTTFHLQGVPHTLLVLSDVAAALREEERLAWQRLIRVLSHEINNSLTPIKSLAGSLRSRLPRSASSPEAEGFPASFTQYLPDFDRGLTVIEDRAASLNRFLQAYQELSRLPAPRLQSIPLREVLDRVIHLETRLPVELHPGPATNLIADPDQLQQLFINVIRNAVEAALSVDTIARHAVDPAIVAIDWSTTPDAVIVSIRDNGPGLTNPANLFVPFYTTKPGGTGIGLVLAQQIAVGHKGSIALFNNKTGSGCTAEVRLPKDAST